MEQLIPIINKLQDVTAVVESSPLDLPQIAVVGEQSSGKSSVLESIVGRDFLPRGSGIVTRRPLALQLINKRAVGGGVKEWGEFLHLPGKKFENFDDIRRHIQEDTDRLGGSNKGISNVPINLKIYSPNVLNLTLIDLPGLTKVPVGDQPKDIASQIRTMVLSYITKPNTIILAISPANADIANSDGLRIAREVDPHGKRTIGVLTKLDLMDKGTDCFEVLMGKVYQLKFGFIGVVNRSQHEIVTKLQMQEAKENESAFFAAHAKYKAIKARCGTPHLAATLSKILMNHIRNTLPTLRQRVSSLLQSARDELEALGDPRLGVSKGALLLHIINSFVLAFTNTIDGRLTTESSTDELYGGARINYIFNDMYTRHVEEIDANGGLTDEEIQVIMANATGPKASLFIPEESFEQLARRQIKILLDPSLRCVDLVYDELQRIVNCIEINELKRFDALREKVVDEVNALLRDCREPTKKMVKSLIDIELAYINTNHPDFIGGGDAIAKILKRRAADAVEKGYGDGSGRRVSGTESIPGEFHQQYQSEVNMMQREAHRDKAISDKREKKKQQQQKQNPNNDGKPAASFWNIFGKKPSPPSSSPSPQASHSRPSKTPAAAPPKMAAVPSVMSVRKKSERSENEDFQTELIETLLTSYFAIVRKNVTDRVPKSIMHFLVNKSRKEIQNRLVEGLYKPDLFDKLLMEGGDVAIQREQHQQTVKICATAQKILNEIIDTKL